MPEASCGAGAQSCNGLWVRSPLWKLNIYYFHFHLRDPSATIDDAHCVLSGETQRQSWSTGIRK